MTLQERRDILAKRLDDIRAASEKYRAMATELARQAEQLVGAVSVLDQLIAETNGDENAIGVESPATLHGDEIRTGEGVKEWEGQHGRLHDDHKAAP